MALGAVGAAVVPYLPTLIDLLAGVGQRFTGAQGDKILGLVSGALKGGAGHLAAAQKIKGMIDDGRDPTDAEIDALIGEVEANTDRLNQAAAKILDGVPGSGEGGD